MENELFYQQIQGLMEGATVPKCPSSLKLNEGVESLGQIKSDTTKKMMGLYLEFIRQANEASVQEAKDLVDELSLKAEVCIGLFWIMAKAELDIFGKSYEDSAVLHENWQIAPQKMRRIASLLISISASPEPERSGPLH
jgi:hypothetical protein